MPQTLVLEDVITSAMETAIQGVWTAMPGRVESYEPALQRANVQLTVKSGTVGENGDRQVSNIAVINAVPIVHAGGGGFREVYPIAAGDTVLVVFMARSIDAWLSQGGIVDPRDDHHHDISDAVAIAGLRDFSHPLKTVPTDHASIGHDSGATIEFRQDEIRIGSDVGTEPTLKATSFLSVLDAFIVSLSTAVGTIPTGGAAASADIDTAATAFVLDRATAITTVAKVV